LNVRYFEKTFTEALKFLSDKTVEELQLGAEPFVVGAGDSTGIIYTPPTVVNFGDETSDVCEFSCYLQNSPITQSEYFVIYGDDGSSNNSKLTLVDGALTGDGQYNVSYDTGLITFYNNQSVNTTNFAYSYGGSILINETRTLSEVYDYMQANLSAVFTTSTGTLYDSYVDIILGDSISVGTLNETNLKTVNFKDGYGWSAGSIGGVTINVLSDNWQFTWVGSNGTFSRKYTYDLTVTDTGGTAIENVSVNMVDLHGDLVFNTITDSNGQVPQQLFTYGTYSSSNRNSIYSKWIGRNCSWLVWLNAHADSDSKKNL